MDILKELEGYWISKDNKVSMQFRSLMSEWSILIIKDPINGVQEKKFKVLKSNNAIVLRIKDDLTSIEKDSIITLNGILTITNDAGSSIVLFKQS
jgi:hypothetical protein